MAKRKNPNDDPKEENKPGDSEDNFGLPDIEFKPLDRTEESSKKETASASSETPKASTSGGGDKDKDKYVYRPPEEKSSASAILWMVLALVVVVAGVLYYQFVYKPSKEKEKQELLAKQEADKKAKEAEAARAKAAAEEAERLRLAEAAKNAKPVEGTITTLTERTRRYYVVVTSNLDDDLLMDYAKVLSKKGVNLKIIPPYGNIKFYRLAIADHETYPLAQANADAAKAEYGSALWVLRY